MAFYRLSLKKNLYLCANKRVNKKMWFSALEVRNSAVYSA